MKKLKPILFNIIRGYATSVFNFLIALYGIKTYGKENWGEIVALLLWVFFVVFFSNWGNQEYLLRKYSRNPSNIFELYTKNLFSRSSLLIFSFLIFLFFPFHIALLAWGLIVLMFFYNSLNSLIIYHQKFGEQLFAECAGAFKILYTIFSFPFDISTLLTTYCIAFTFKLIYLTIDLKLWRNKCTFNFSFQEFTNANSFFLIGFMGWLVSKTDLYIVSYFFTKTTLSSYQLFSTSFLMLQALSALMLLPYNKHFYRLNQVTIDAIQRKIAIISIPIALIGTVAIWLLLSFLVGINFPIYYYLFGFFTVIPHYLTAIDYLKLKRENQEKRIAALNIIGFLSTLLTSVLLINTLGLEGLLYSMMFTQWLLFLLLKYSHR